MKLLFINFMDLNILKTMLLFHLILMMDKESKFSKLLVIHLIIFKTIILNFIYL